MKWLPRGPDRSVRSQLAIVLTLALVASLTVIVPALATHGNSELPGSNFEIDTDANLKNDGDGTDWANLAHPNGPEFRATDVATGQNDNSYKGGTKEDTECPNETTGSIPNNKSDLLTFHVYEEPGSPGFLNLAWSRVSDPSGTTLMDFEFNQSTTPCPQGPNVERTEGDLLLEYAIDQGGAQADISGRFWDDTAGEWGPSVDLDQPNPLCGGNPCAVGTINMSPIPFGESDGLITEGQKDARTFGEAQIDLDLIFDENKCSSFGSAMLKSRSSDSFTSQLKDFISPIPIDLQNCGNVIIRKQTDPDGASGSFGFTKNFPTDPATLNTFSLSDDGVKDFGDDVLFGTGYEVSEDLLNLPSGFDLVDIDCNVAANPSVGVTPVIDLANGKVTFDIDADTDVLDCTFTNRARASLTVVKQTENATGTFGFSSATLSPASFSLTTTDEGEAGVDSTTFGNLVPGTYDVAEDMPLPTGWSLTSATCDNDDTPDAVTLAAGDDVTCTFVDTATADLTVTKITQDLTGTFDFTSTTLSPAEFSLTTTATGATGSDSESFSGIAPDGYDVSETVPAGWNLVNASCDNGDDPGSITLGIGDDVECTFTNAPETGAIKISKTRKHAAAGLGVNDPHAGVTFNISGGSLAEGGTDVMTNANGEACLDGLILSTFTEISDYTVTETVPSGYVADGATAKTVSVTTEATCGDGNEATVSFGNTPLTDVQVIIDSQVDGGTFSSVVCDFGSAGDTDPLSIDDVTLDVDDLSPGTYTCTIVIDP